MTTSSKINTCQPEAIEAAILKQWLAQQAVTLVDVREPVEYAGEHLAGSILVPLSKFDPSQIPNEGQKVVVYCQSGRRSTQAAQQLVASGFEVENLVTLKGGLNAWKAEGYQTKLNKKAPISLMRQVQIVAGSLVLTGTLLGAFVSPGFLVLSGFVGAGLMFAGITNTCGLALLLAKLPYNQQS
ncbi:MAG: rhodanese-like domain-containing protein [Limnoraphis sp. WC205]|nr:rhodanese-like domain-containing protein [Limnoraphis sp. WC205]